MPNLRKEVADLLIDNLKLIDGNISSFDNSYTYSADVANNVFRGFKFIDEINDFPYITTQMGVELRNYNTDGLREAELPVIIRFYVRDENSQQTLESLSQDIEHVIYELQPNTNLEMKDITIESISSDEGLFTPYGIGEILINVSYVLAN